MQRLTKLRVLMITLMVGVLVFSIGTAALAKAVTIRFAHVAPETDPRHEAALKFKEIVERDSKGEIKVEVFHSGQLGGDRDLIEGLRLGTIDVTVNGAGIYALFEPKMGLSALPFLFSDFASAHTFNDGPVAAQVSKLLIPKGIRVLSYWENGFRCITNSVRPINSPEDVKGLKIRTPENPVIMATIRALGANVTPMPWPEVYTALQQGTVDGQENPIPIIWANKIYEVQKYLAITNHVYEPMPLTIRESLWQSLSPDQKLIVKNAAIQAGAFNRRLAMIQTRDYISKLEAKGMVITYPDLAPFQDATASVKNQFVDQYGQDLIDAAYSW